jgi:hypothetical protein
LGKNVFVRRSIRVANNIALAGDQQHTELAYRQNIVVTVPGNTRFYIVLARPSGNQAPPARTTPAINSGATSVGAAALPSVQELRRLMQLKSKVS